MTRYRVRQERAHWTNRDKKRGWFVYSDLLDRPDWYPTASWPVSWHPTWEAAMELADALAHYGRGH